MHGVDNHGESSSSPSAFFDPRIAALATFAVALLPYGAWRVFTRPQQQQQNAQDNDHQMTALDSQHVPHDNPKQKRSKERRRRAAVPKLKTGGGVGQLQQKKLVIRQPSAVARNRKLRTPSLAADEPDDLQDEYNNETPRPTSTSRFEDPPQRGRSNRPIDISGDAHFSPLTSSLCPQDIPLPLSPVLAPTNTLQRSSPPLSATSSPVRRPISPFLPSPSVSTSTSTSGTPLTPPSLMTSQVLPMAPLHALYTQGNPAWDWPSQSSILAGPPGVKPSPKAKRPRNSSPTARECVPSTKGSDTAPAPPQADDGSKLQAPAQELTFPTLNALPPPSMPLEDQVEILRSSIEASRTREQVARQREEALTLELEQSRIEVEQTRQEVSKLQWQLNEISQREERLQSHMHALTMQLQAIHHGRPPAPPLPVPMVFQPQPMSHPHFYQSPHPFAPPSPMIASQTPPSAPFPVTQMPMPHPHLSPMIMPLHIGRSQSTPGPTTPLESFQPPHPHYHRHSPALHHPQAQRHHTRGPSEMELRAGLLEAIMKHPNSLAMGSHRHSVGESVESGRASVGYSRSASISVSGSGGSMNVSRSGSATGSRSDDADDALVNVYPHTHADSSDVVEGRGEETLGTGGGCGVDAEGGSSLTHNQSDLSTHEQQQSLEPLDQVTEWSEGNAVPIYY